MTRELQAQEAWSEHIAVHKPYRQMGLGSELRSRIFEDLKSRGIKRLYGGTLSSNLPSLKLARRMGFKELVDVRFVCILGFRSWSYRKVRENVTGAD
jgi:L-amino acid N-acyltransferase YncA